MKGTDPQRRVWKSIFLAMLLFLWLFMAPCRMLGPQKIIRIYQSDVPSLLIGVNHIGNSSIIQEPVMSMEEGITQGKIRLVYEGEWTDENHIVWKTEEAKAYILFTPEQVLFVNHTEEPIRVSNSLRTDCWGIGDWNGCYLTGRGINAYHSVIEAGETKVNESHISLFALNEGHYLFAMDFIFEEDHLEDPYYCSPGRYWICETEFDYYSSKIPALLP